MSRPWSNPILMKRLYVDEGLTAVEVGEKLGCSERTVRTWLKKHGIETRSRGRKPSWESTDPPMYQLGNSDGYEVVETFDPIRDDDGEVVDTVRRVVQIHRLVAIAHWGYQAVMKDGVEVHHRNGMKLDNRPDNLVPMEKRRHANVSWKRRWDQPIVGDYSTGDDGPPGTEWQLDVVKEQEH